MHTDLSHKCKNTNCNCIELIGDDLFMTSTWTGGGQARMVCLDTNMGEMCV